MFQTEEDSMLWEHLVSQMVSTSSYNLSSCNRQFSHYIGLQIQHVIVSQFSFLYKKYVSSWLNCWAVMKRFNVSLNSALHDFYCFFTFYLFINLIVYFCPKSFKSEAVFHHVIQFLICKVPSGKTTIRPQSFCSISINMFMSCPVPTLKIT